MGISLLESDYGRFADDLKNQKNPHLIVALIEDWRFNHEKSNPSFMSMLVSVIMNRYSIWGFEVNSEIVEQYDLNLYSQYEHPSLEFTCDYIYYIIEKEIDEKSAQTTIQEEEINYYRQKLSFQIDKKYSASILNLAKKLKANIDFFLEGTTKEPEKLFVEILVAENLMTFDIAKYKIRFNCKTREAVYVFNNIKEVYSPKNLDTVIDRCGLFFSKQDNPITKSLLYKERNKLKIISSLENKVLIDRIFRECYPSSF